MPIGKIPVPPDHIESEPTVKICLNKGWANVLIGQIWGLRYPEAWGGTLDENRRARGEIKNLITMLMGDEECGDMNDCCVELQIINRVNVETGDIEISIDNGDTWRPKPNAPKSFIINPPPPIPAGVTDNKCDAASDGMAQIEFWIDATAENFDTATTLLEFCFLVAAAVAGAILTVLTGGGFSVFELAIIEAVGAALIAVWNGGKTAFVDYWTTTNKDIILCALFCTIGDDGSFTQAQFQELRTKLKTQLPKSNAKTLFMGVIDSISLQGMNRMCATGTSTSADCSDCTDCVDCGTNWVTWTHFSNMGTIINDPVTDGYIELQSQMSSDFGAQAAGIFKTPEACCLLDHVEVTGNNGTMSIYYSECGHDPSVTGGNINTGVGATIGSSMNMITIYGGTAVFTVKIYMF